MSRHPARSYGVLTAMVVLVHAIVIGERRQLVDLAGRTATTTTGDDDAWHHVDQTHLHAGEHVDDREHAGRGAIERHVTRWCRGRRSGSGRDGWPDARTGQDLVPLVVIGLRAIGLDPAGGATDLGDRTPMKGCTDG